MTNEPPPIDLRPMYKVAFVTHVANFGGSTQSLRILLKTLDPSVGRVFVGPKNSPVARGLCSAGLVSGAVDVAPSGLAAFIGAARLAAMTRWGRLDVTALHANGTGDLVLCLPTLLVCPKMHVTVWVHDQAVKTWAIRLRRLIRMVGTRISWAPVSEVIGGQLVELGLTDGPHITVPNPIEPCRAPSTADVARRIDRPTTVGFLGNPTLRKGFDLLPAVADVVSEHGGKMLLFTNKGKDHDSRVTAAWHKLEHRADDSVTVVGRVSDPCTALAQCDLVFVPSRLESFGRVVAEAMAAGIPVVASDIPAFREVAGHEGAEFFEPGSAASAAEAIRRVFGSRELRARLGKNGLRESERFRPESIAATFQGLYETSPPQ